MPSVVKAWRRRGGKRIGGGVSEQAGEGGATAEAGDLGGGDGGGSAGGDQARSGAEFFVRGGVMRNVEHDIGADQAEAEDIVERSRGGHRAGQGLRRAGRKSVTSMVTLFRGVAGVRG